MHEVLDVINTLLTESCMHAILNVSLSAVFYQLSLSNRSVTMHLSQQWHADGINLLRVLTSS